MIDLCYFVNMELLLLLWRFGPQQNLPLFHALFALVAGPLSGAIVVWKNSLVLHDLDRLTSLYIHFVPGMLMYALRWLTPGMDALPLPSLWDFVMPALGLYCYWQVFYLLKTEVIDRKHLQSDKEIVTSLRWMSEIQPHPVYKYIRETRGWNVPAIVVMVCFQFVCASPRRGCLVHHPSDRVLVQTLP